MVAPGAVNVAPEADRASWQRELHIKSVNATPVAVLFTASSRWRPTSDPVAALREMKRGGREIERGKWDPEYE